jgi:hypothetical protein
VGTTWRQDGVSGRRGEDSTVSERPPDERGVRLDCTECLWSETVPTEGERTASDVLLAHARETGHQVAIDGSEDEADDSA